MAVEQVDAKKKKYHLGQRAAEVEVVIDRLIARHEGDTDRALLSVIAETSLEKQVSF